MRGMSTYELVDISPPTITKPVVMNVSQATRACGSFASTASRTESETWSAILSGWPSVTDSDVKENERADMRPRLAAGVAESDGECRILAIRRGVRGQGAGVQEAGALRRHVGERRHPLREARLAESAVRRELLAAAPEGGDPGLRGRENELAADLRAVQREPAQRAELRQRGLRVTEIGRRGDDRELAATPPVHGGLALEDGVELGRK